MTYAATTKPAWLTFNAVTGVLSGTPANSDVGDHSVVLTATDAAGAVDTQSFTLTVSNTNDAPIVSSSAIIEATEDTAYSYTFAAFDVDLGDTHSYAITTKPSWLDFDAATGVLSGTPTNDDVGYHDIVLSVNEYHCNNSGEIISQGVTVNQSFTITVTNTNDAPTISVSNGSLTEDSGTYTVLGSIVGSDVDTNTTLTYASNTLTGSYGALSLNTNTGAYTYTLNNSNSDVQGLNASETLTESFTVSVSDGTATTSTTLSFTINGANDGPAGLALSASSVAENSAGDTIGTLSATDADGDTLTYTLASGGDNDSFEISGTTLKLKDSVAANYEANNVYDLNITVTDGTSSQSISQEVTVTNVNEANTSYYYGKADTNASSSLNSTGNAAIEQLMTGGFWGSQGYGIDLTYSFINSNSYVDSLYSYFRPEVGSYTAVSTYLKTTVEDILDLYSSVSLLNFVEVSDNANSVGHLRFGTSTSTYANRAIFPHWYSPMAGDIWLNSQNNYFNNNTALMDGSYWNFTTNHEIGHAIGLAHTQHAMTYGGRTYGTDQSYGTVHNALPYSIMSYAEYVGVEIDSTSHTQFFLPTTLMIDDIAALQHLYGVNEKYNSGDNTFTLSSFNDGLLSSSYLGIDYIYASIWDAGGEDTFSWSDQTTIASINLNDGEFSCFGNISGPDDTNLDDFYLSDGDGILGIAYDAVIENAIGGSNTDTILGNESDNKLYGGTGSGVKDTLTGGAGADTFICSISDATTDINLADIITDFAAGTDKIGLEDITVAELSWSDTSGGTQIYEASTSKILFNLNSVSASAIDEDDFVQTDFV